MSSPILPGHPADGLRDAILRFQTLPKAPNSDLTIAETVERLRGGFVASIIGDDEAVLVEDGVLETPNRGLAYRLYRPRRSDVKGVLVNFHGGGWVAGSIATDDGRCRALAAAAGCPIVSIDYRLAPETVYPGPLEDCYAGLCSLSERLTALGLPDKGLAVGGSSAGANLAAATALLARDRDGPALVFQHLLVPVTDADFTRSSYIEFGKGLIIEAEALAWYWDRYCPSSSDRLDGYAAPLRAGSLAGLPPALVQTAECDPVRDEGEAYAARLKAFGVPTTLTRYRGMVHGFVGIAPGLASSLLAVREAADCLRLAFGASPVDRSEQTA